MSARKHQVLVQQEQVPINWPEVYVYGAKENEGHCGARHHQGPTAVYDDGFRSPNIVGPTPLTALMDVEYWPSQNLGPSNTTRIPNVALQRTDYLTFTAPATSMPAMTYDAIPVFAPDRNTAPTFGGQNGNVFVTPVQTAPPMTARVPRKVKRPQKEKVAVGPYIKKPLNAFMLFLKQNRKSAEEELGVRTSATVNKLLGERWKLLSAKEKAKYTAEAKADSYLHSIDNPGWSSKINYLFKKRVKVGQRILSPEDWVYLCGADANFISDEDKTIYKFASPKWRAARLSGIMKTCQKALDSQKKGYRAKIQSNT